MKKLIFITTFLISILGFSQKQIVNAVGFIDADTAMKTALTNISTTYKWQVYATPANRFEFWDGDSWESFGGGGSSTNIYNADGVTPDSGTRFFDLGEYSSLYIRNNDYSNFIYFNDSNLELRNTRGNLRFRTGTGGSVSGNSVGDVWTATSVVGDGHWAAPSGGSGISNIVEDTTPQLGGNLDVNDFYLTSGGSDGLTVRSANNDVYVNKPNGLMVNNYLRIINDNNNSNYGSFVGTSLSGSAFQWVVPNASGTIALEADASGFNGNLGTGDNTLQEIAQKFDDYTSGGSGTDDQTASEVLMTGYVKNITAGVALSAADNVNQGLGKLEKTTEDLRTDVNLIALGFAADGDKGDVTVSGAGSIWSIDNNAVTDAKIATAVNANKIANGSVSNTEYQYLNGVTSSIQTQIDSKIGDVTKAGDADGYFENGTGATTFVQIGETGYGKIYADAVTKQVGLSADEFWISNVQGSTGVGYFDLSTLANGTTWVWELPSKSGTIALTSDIPDSTIDDSSQATTYTFALGDEDKIITYNNASDGTFITPTNASVAFDVGTILTVESIGVGHLTIDNSNVTGVDVSTSSGSRMISIKKTATDTWRVVNNDATPIYNQASEPSVTGTQVPNTASFVANVDMKLYRFKEGATWYYFWLQLGT